VITNAGAAAGAAAAAAAAAERARCEEEEEMTGYEPRDLDEAWEFKILRSRMTAFGNPATLRRILDEEAAAGWELVEKFDDSRIRLKRRVAHRENDDLLEFDAYRTYAGMSQGNMAVVVTVAIVAAFLFAGILFSALAFG
jgi:hypothetical protein